MVGSKGVKTHRAIFLLSLLKANNNEPIKGRTKLEKLLFLIKQDILADTQFDGSYYFFEPYKYGPFTTEILDDVVLMEDFGYLKRERIGDDVIYSITSQGQTKIQQINQNLSTNIKTQIDEINKKIEKLKKDKNKLPLRQLLTYVYQKFPYYTTNSEIKGKVLVY